MLNADFFKYAEEKLAKSVGSDNSVGVIRSALVHLKKYTFRKTRRERLPFKEITPAS